MGKYPHIKPSNLNEFLSDIDTRGLPEKITQKTLPIMGYKSSYDRQLIPVLRFIDFVDKSGAPAQNYKDFKNRAISRASMAKTVQTAYKDLFTLYPDAYQRDDKSLGDFFSGFVTEGKGVLDETVDTFKTLCSFAEFKAVPSKEKGKSEEGDKGKKGEEGEGGKPPAPATGVTINLNIQLALPATEDAKVYENIFKALRDNLLARD